MLANPVCDDLDAMLPPGGALSGRLLSRLLGDEPDDTPLPPGTRIGCWRIETLFGRGGSATVYLADRADGHFEQQVALKVVRPNRNLIEQFRRERQILANLRHPAIARLIDGGETDDGRLWFAMEPVFGERIDDHVRHKRLPLNERLSLFEDVCDAVAYAHTRALIHGDIKPGNLLVDDAGRPRLRFRNRHSGRGRARQPLPCNDADLRESRATRVRRRHDGFGHLSARHAAARGRDARWRALCAVDTIHRERTGIDHRLRDIARARAPIPERCRDACESRSDSQPTCDEGTRSDTPPARSTKSKAVRRGQRLAARRCQRMVADRMRVMRMAIALRYVDRNRL